MKNKTLNILLTVFIGMSCSLSAASSEEGNLDRLLDLSGINKQVGEYPGLVKLGFTQSVQQATLVSEEDFSLMVASIDKTILPSIILDKIRYLVKESLTDKDVNTLLVWYESELGKRITAEEEKASTPEGYQQMQNTAQQLFKNTSRVEVAMRLDDLLGATDMTMRMQESTSVAAYSAIMTSITPDQAVMIEDYKSQLAALAPQMRANLQQIVIISFVYSYQAIDDDSLAKYEAFLGNSITKRFNKSVMSGLELGFEKVVTSWLDEISAIAKNRNNAQTQTEQ